MGAFAVVLALLAPALAPAPAKAVSPVLEFVSSASALPIDFTAAGGEVTAEMEGYDTELHCMESAGEGQVVGPRAALSEYVFEGCETRLGEEGGAVCSSDAAEPGVIETGTIEAELVYIDQAKRQVGMLLNPSGGIYMEFDCGAQSIKGLGPFLSPVGPINEEATSFTATLSRSGATQIPGEYENPIGEKRSAVPMGERNDQPSTRATTGVELSFAIHTSASLEIKAITAAEIEAKQREEEAAAAKKRQDEEAAARKRQEEEAAAAAAKRQREKARADRLRRARLRSKGLTRCRKAQSKRKRVRCEKRVKKKHGGQRRSKG